MDFIKKNRMWIGIGACVAVVIGCFLPFASVSAFGISQSVNFIEGDGKIVLITAVISGVLLYLQNGKYQKYSWISSAIGLFITLYDAANGSKKIGGLLDLHMGIGFTIILLGFIVAIVVPFIKSE